MHFLCISINISQRHNQTTSTRNWVITHAELLIVHPYTILHTRHTLVTQVTMVLALSAL